MNASDKDFDGRADRIPLKQSLLHSTWPLVQVEMVWPQVVDRGRGENSRKGGASRVSPAIATLVTILRPPLARSQDASSPGEVERRSLSMKSSIHNAMNDTG